MSLKYSSTTADYLQWSEAMNLIRKLAKGSNYKMSLLIALGCFTGINAPVLISQKGTVYTVQRINVMLKEIKRKYRLHIGNFSCHSLRKTFGRQVYNMNSDSSELALVKLMELFNHSSVSITKRYLGLRQEELLNTYDCLSF